MPTSRLTCPECGRTFDYSYVPGASFTAVRLGSRRYFACPLCGKRSLFDLRSPVPAGPTRAEVPRVSDSAHVRVWLPLFLVPVVVATTALALLLPRPEPAILASSIGVVIVAVGCILLLVVARPPRR